MAACAAGGQCLLQGRRSVIAIGERYRSDLRQRRVLIFFKELAFRCRMSCFEHQVGRPLHRTGGMIARDWYSQDSARIQSSLDVKHRDLIERSRQLPSATPTSL